MPGEAAGAEAPGAFGVVVAVIAMAVIMLKAITGVDSPNLRAKLLAEQGF